MLNRTMMELGGTFREDTASNSWLLPCVPCTEAAAVLDEVEAWLNDEEPPDPYCLESNLPAGFYGAEWEGQSLEDEIHEEWLARQSEEEEAEEEDPSDFDLSDDEPGETMVLYSSTGVAHAMSVDDIPEGWEVDFYLTPEVMANRFQEQRKVSKDRKAVRMEMRENKPKRPAQKPEYKTRKKHRLPTSLAMALPLTDDEPGAMKPTPRQNDFVVIPNTLFGEMHLPTKVPPNQLVGWATTGSLDKLRARNADL